jgi:tetratricopeptide (TPR) repeat protein
LGKIHFNQSDFGNALRNFKLMGNLADKIKNKRLSFEAYGFIGNVLMHLNKLDRALTVYRKAELIARSANDFNLISIACNNTARIFIRQGKFIDALKYQKESLSLSQKCDIRAVIIDAKRSLAEIYGHLEQPVTALQLFKEIMQLHQKFNANDRTTIDLLNNLGTACRKLKQYKEAAKYFRLCIKFSLELKTDYNLVNYYGLLARVYQSSGQLSRALTGFKKIIEKYSKDQQAGYEIAAITFYAARILFIKRKFKQLTSYLESAREKLILQNKVRPYPFYADFLAEIDRMQKGLPKRFS